MDARWVGVGNLFAGAAVCMGKPEWEGGREGKPELVPSTARFWPARNAGHFETTTKKHVIMQEPRSNRTRNPSRSGRTTYGFPMAALPTVLLVCLSIALVTACAGGRDSGDRVDVSGETVDVIFPQHDVPAADYWRERFVGKLTLEDGCLRAGSVLLIWPAGFTFDTKNGVVRVIDADGRIVAHGGDDVRFSRAHVSFEEARDGGRIVGLSDDCAGPYWLVGGEVVAISPGEPAKSPVVKGPEVHFPQHGAPLGTDDGGRLLGWATGPGRRVFRRRSPSRCQRTGRDSYAHLAERVCGRRRRTQRANSGCGWPGHGARRRPHSSDRGHDFVQRSPGPRANRRDVRRLRGALFHGG